MLKSFDGAAVEPYALRPQVEIVICLIGDDGAHQAEEVEGFPGILEELCRRDSGIRNDPEGADSGGWVVAIGKASCPPSSRFPIELRLEVAGEAMAGDAVIQQDVTLGGQALTVAGRHRRTVGCASVIGQRQSVRAQSAVSVQEVGQRVRVFRGWKEEGRQRGQEVGPNLGVEQNVEEAVTAEERPAGQDCTVAYLSSDGLRIKVVRPLDPDPLVVGCSGPISQTQFDQHGEGGIVLRGDETVAGSQ